MWKKGVLLVLCGAVMMLLLYVFMSNVPPDWGKIIPREDRLEELQQDYESLQGEYEELLSDYDDLLCAKADVIEAEELRYYAEEIVGRAEMTMSYFEGGDVDREEAIYHLGIAIDNAEGLLDYCD